MLVAGAACSLASGFSSGAGLSALAELAAAHSLFLSRARLAVAAQIAS
jgi:hypothetical protein